MAANETTLREHERLARRIPEAMASKGVTDVGVELWGQLDALGLRHHLGVNGGWPA